MIEDLRKLPDHIEDVLDEGASAYLMHKADHMAKTGRKPPLGELLHIAVVAMVAALPGEDSLLNAVDLIESVLQTWDAQSHDRARALRGIRQLRVAIKEYERERKDELVQQEAQVEVFKRELLVAQKENQRLLRLMRCLHNAVLPDPCDEREISLKWLMSYVNRITSTALNPKDPAK